jgi:molybdopterin converting factor small subunit
MKEEIAITIRLFGAFRAYGESVTFRAASGISVHDVKERLGKELGLKDAALIYDSALANDDEIIGGNAVLTQDSLLAILPPVCGG